MTKYRPTQQQTRDLVTEWVKRLNLHAWIMQVGFESMEDAEAETRYITMGKRARIVFDLKSDNFSSVDELERAVVHELIHVVMRETTRTIKKLYTFAYGEESDLGQNFLLEFTLHVEDLCDHMAKVLIEINKETT